MTTDLTSEQLEELGRLRALGQMLAGFIHQLRTPLSIIQSTVEDLRTVKKLPKEANQRLDMVQRSVDRMQTAVQTLLGFARGDQTELHDGSVNRVIDRVVDYLQEECPRRKIKLEKVLDEKLPMVPLQAQQLEEALINLTVNAMEAMPEGGVLSLITQPSAGGQQVIVKDQGLGMSPEALANLGAPFQTSKTKGLGLGLFLTKKITEAHHAGLSFESELGHGTTATVTFLKEAA